MGLEWEPDILTKNMYASNFVSRACYSALVVMIYYVELGGLVVC